MRGKGDEEEKVRKWSTYCSPAKGPALAKACSENWCRYKPMCLQFINIRTLATTDQTYLDVFVVLML